MASGKLGAGKPDFWFTFFSVVVSTTETHPRVVEWYRWVAASDVRGLCILVCRTHFPTLNLSGLA